MLAAVLAFGWLYIMQIVARFMVWLSLVWSFSICVAG